MRCLRIPKFNNILYTVSQKMLLTTYILHRTIMCLVKCLKRMEQTSTVTFVGTTHTLEKVSKPGLRILRTVIKAKKKFKIIHVSLIQRSPNIFSVVYTQRFTINIPNLVRNISNFSQNYTGFKFVS